MAFLERFFSRIGASTVDRIWRLGFAARFFMAMLAQSGETFRRPRLLLRELFASGVLSLIIILVSGLFVGLVLGLQGYDTLQRYGSSEALGILVAVNPLARIMAPRFWGGVISMPLLAALFTAAGIFGGWLIGVVFISVDEGAFWAQMQASVDFRHDVFNGIIKSAVFGVAVSLIAVFEGFDSVPTAEGVSRAITRTVVTSALAILALDFVLTSFMFRGL